MTRPRRRHYNPHPLSDTCVLCDQPLGDRRNMVVRRGSTYHRTCWEREKGE